MSFKAGDVEFAYKTFLIRYTNAAPPSERSFALDMRAAFLAGANWHGFALTQEEMEAEMLLLLSASKHRLIDIEGQS
jgi:hypothetical protein